METLNEALALKAFYNTSHDPEGRGRRTIQEHKEILQADYQELLAHASTPELKAILDEEFARYQAGYTARKNEWLAASSRCISSFITGPSNFPTSRAEKANRREHNLSTECTDYRAWSKKRILRALHPELAPIKTSDEDAQERLQAKINGLKESQAMMKAANKAIRANFKTGYEGKLAALIEIGLTEDQAHKILKPDCFGCIGFAHYSLSNNNAEIRRLEQRLAYIKKTQATPASEAQGTAARLEDAPQDNRVRLFFPGKPSEELRTDLKRSGFRWTPSLGCWQAFRNPMAMDRARKFAGIA